MDRQQVTSGSIGMVDDPTGVKEPGHEFTDPAVFLDRIQRIDALRDLVRDAEPLHSAISIAANDSMANELVCKFDKRW